jgi:pyruvate kinase
MNSLIGDLGVELPAHEVPYVQKELIHKAKMARKFQLLLLPK